MLEARGIGVVPAAWGRDTLRLAGNLSLYGHEISTGSMYGSRRDPEEKPDFIGPRRAWEKRKAEALKRQLIGIEMIAKSPATATEKG